MKTLFTLLFLAAMAAMAVAGDYIVVPINYASTPATDTVASASSDIKVTGYIEKMVIKGQAGNTQNIFIVSSNVLTGVKTTLCTTNRQVGVSEILPRFYPANSNGLTVSSSPEKYFLYQEYIIVSISNAFTSNTTLKVFNFLSK